MNQEEVLWKYGFRNIWTQLQLCKLVDYLQRQSSSRGTAGALL